MSVAILTRAHLRLTVLARRPAASPATLPQRAACLLNLRLLRQHRYVKEAKVYCTGAVMTAERYMMHRKALLFAPDSAITEEILRPGKTQKEIKALGQQIPHFGQETWLSHRYEITG
ncbi:hypothetical protein WJX73_009372 [Symbiochloris irregularis]|uniref:NADAR domain-containing protein n=1 Tax=Symbiochloris irregularis TaxID=706552 RepID=A0AAW1NYW6_9CHLO